LSATVSLLPHPTNLEDHMRMLSSAGDHMIRPPVEGKNRGLGEKRR
jgi:hypothetical protein